MSSAKKGRQKDASCWHVSSFLPAFFHRAKPVSEMERSGIELHCGAKKRKSRKAGKAKRAVPERAILPKCEARKRSQSEKISVSQSSFHQPKRRTIHEYKKKNHRPVRLLPPMAITAVHYYHHHECSNSHHRYHSRPGHVWIYHNLHYYIYFLLRV